MSIVKSILAGLAGAVLAVVLAVMVLMAGFAVWRAQQVGAGGIGAVSVGIAPLTLFGLVPIAGFVLGMVWWRRRTRRKVRGA